MGEIGAAEFCSRRTLRNRVIDAIEIAPARIAVALGDAFGDFADAGVEGRGHGRPFVGRGRVERLLLRLGE
jgi:hypothetical protein